MLLLWVPLRQWPGLGTVSNVFVIGLATDVALALLSTPDGLWTRVFLLGAGIVLNGLAGAMYIGSQFGAGPRDGLMTGLVRRTGLSVRLVRTSLEARRPGDRVAARRRGRCGHRAVCRADRPDRARPPAAADRGPRGTRACAAPAAAGAPAPVPSGSAPGSALSAATS